jgi:hypothetical protein
MKICLSPTVKSLPDIFGSPLLTALDNILTSFNARQASKLDSEHVLERDAYIAKVKKALSNSGARREKSSEVHSAEIAELLRNQFSLEDIENLLTGSSCF